ncbi:hypothetical protein THAOC_30580, partial [Thalassiosira oceanica]
ADDVSFLDDGLILRAFSERNANALEAQNVVEMSATRWTSKRLGGSSKEAEAEQAARKYYISIVQVAPVRATADEKPHKSSNSSPTTESTEKTMKIHFAVATAAALLSSANADVSPLADFAVDVSLLSPRRPVRPPRGTPGFPSLSLSRLTNWSNSPPSDELPAPDSSQPQAAGRRCCPDDNSVETCKERLGELRQNQKTNWGQ